MRFIDRVLPAVNLIEDVFTPVQQFKARRILASSIPVIDPLIDVVQIAPNGHRIETRTIVDANEERLVSIERVKSSLKARPNRIAIDFPHRPRSADPARSMTITRRWWRVGIEGSIGGIYLQRNSPDAFTNARNTLDSLDSLKRIIR